ncbi:MAG: hypothetical protein K9M57_10815, partial [Phycisphaerae bacterium]|nr:hypothetical protein [Phycisphaerae bacterium]
MPFDAEVNDNFNCGSVIIQNNSLNNKTRLRFRCDGEVYLDEITISATKSGKTGTRFIVDI